MRCCAKNDTGHITIVARTASLQDLRGGGGGGRCGMTSLQRLIVSFTVPLNPLNGTLRVLKPSAPSGAPADDLEGLDFNAGLASAQGDPSPKATHPLRTLCTPGGGRAINFGGRGRCSPRARPPTKSKAQLTAPTKSCPDYPRAPEVTRTQILAKNE